MQQKPTQQEIQETLKLHSLWLKDNTKGEQADFSNKDLSYANLSGADLSHAYLSDANLSGAILNDANLSGADLSGANLSRTNLSGANLSRTNLSRTNLSGAYLTRTNLSGANLSWANLSYATLSGANLSWADLSWAILSGAKYNEKTTWPKASMVVSAYWPNETKEIEALVSPMIQKLLSKHLVLEPEEAKTSTKESCENIVIINGIQYVPKQ